MHSHDQKQSQSGVRTWEEIVEIPTYEVGDPNKNPIFLDKRVYQGSSGRVYPYPVIDKIFDQKQLHAYHMIFLENEYLHIEIMPELGGRIYRALDKTNNYDFVYYNRVIKPALVGLTGPWISGGIEFNWPQHHRPNTFGPVDWKITHNQDGSQTVWVSEIDHMFGTKGMIGFTLYPGKAFLEITGQLYNRTTEPQTFLWWANPALAVNDDTQTIFPPDVTAVFDHGKRDVSRFPVATGTYYKIDYSAGVDISRFKNIPVPTSYMAYKSDYNFVGGYDFGKQAGILHVANHHLSPGKKQWTWGAGDFGRVWYKNLTDDDGPYIELMTGVFTDNQPDFSWLHPNEEKTFKQYFMPYKAIGAVKNATIDAAVNFELDMSTEESQAKLSVYATSQFPHAMIEVFDNGKAFFTQTITLSPTEPFMVSLTVDPAIYHQWKVIVNASDGRMLVSYQPPAEYEIVPMPDPAKPLLAPQELKNTEELYLAGLHLEQYRHATYEPEDYYREGLRRDHYDIRINNAYGNLLFRRGLFVESEHYFRRAITTLTRHNPNPYDGEAYYNLGKTLKMQNRLDEAYAAFFKSVWNAAFQDSGYLALAQIACIQGDLIDALDFIEKSIMRQYRSPLARNMKAAFLRRLGRLEEAINLLEKTIAFDPLDFIAYHQLTLIYRDLGDGDAVNRLWNELDARCRSDQDVLFIVNDYAVTGLYAEAIDVLHRIVSHSQNGKRPMLLYSLGYLHDQEGRHDQAKQLYQQASHLSPDYCFPNTIWDYIVLQRVLTVQPEDAKAHYYMGNWLYAMKRSEDAIGQWEISASLDPQFPTVQRNLALAYANKQGKWEQAMESLRHAFALNTTDSRVFYELDQLSKKMGHPHMQRLSRLEAHIMLVDQRDDLFIEYITLCNQLGRHEDALTFLLSRQFHPWEGGEGKVTGQYVIALLEMGKSLVQTKGYQEALQVLIRALNYPDNLGEGKLCIVQENQIYYYLGLAYEGLNQREEAQESYVMASHGLIEPAGAMFYNDQPPDTIFYQGLALQRLGRDNEANSRFHKLVDYGEKHLFDELKIDYFAVSLPDFLVFEDDLNIRNQVHCRYMIGLGTLGLGDIERARRELLTALAIDINHQGVAGALRLIP
jgi:tetratricopeptide (TPR) repeat protein